MKIIYLEEPREWRKSVWLTALGLALLSSVLRWRRHLPVNVWLAVLVMLGLVAVAAWLRPRWFRGWYRLSLWLGFHSSQFVGRCVLALIFILLVTPLGWVLRALGQDPLQLRRPPNGASYWRPARESNPLDRLF